MSDSTIPILFFTPCICRPHNVTEINFVLQHVGSSCFQSIDSSEDADFIGCVTDRLPTGRELTIPVYANYCSAHCYEEDEAALARLERCPYGGEQHEIPTGIHREEPRGAIQ